MAQVKLILAEEVPNLGDAGDLVSVKPGYARNYLLPTGKAVLATEARINELEHHRRIIAEKVAKQLKDLEQTRSQIQKLSLSVEAQAGEGGRLFGSVTAIRIAELLAEQGFEIDRRKIQLKEPIKEVGEHSVPIRLHKEMRAEVKLTVIGVGGAAPEEEAPPERESAPPAEAPAGDEPFVGEDSPTSTEE